MLLGPKLRHSRRSIHEPSKGLVIAVEVSFWAGIAGMLVAGWQLIKLVL